MYIRIFERFFFLFKTPGWSNEIIDIYFLSSIHQLDLLDLACILREKYMARTWNCHSNFEFYRQKALIRMLTLILQTLIFQDHR